METFVELVNFIDGHPVVIRVSAINQIMGETHDSTTILLEDEDGVIVNGSLSDVLKAISDAQEMTARLYASKWR